MTTFERLKQAVESDDKEAVAIFICAIGESASCWGEDAFLEYLKDNMDDDDWKSAYVSKYTITVSNDSKGR